MRPGVLHRVVLVIAGCILVAVGAGGAFVPDAFFSGFGIVIGGDAGLRSELRSAGLTLLLLGVTIGVGAFVSRLTIASTLIAAIVFLGYFSGRLISWMVDGAPSPAAMAAGAIELAVGATCVWLMLRQRGGPSL